MIQFNYLKCCFNARKQGYCISTKLDEQTVMTFVEDDYRNKLEARYKVQDASHELDKRKRDIRRQVKRYHEPIPF